MLDKIKRIANYFPYCLTIVDVKAQGRPCIFVNDKFLENTGYEPHEAIGRNLSYLQDELTPQETIEFMRQYFAKKVSCIQDVINYKKDGTPFLNRLLMLPLSMSGTQSLYLGIQNDITSIKGLKHDNASLAKVNDGEIKHMVNNPLSVILGKVGIALKNSSTDEQIDKTAKSLSEMFERINQYALNIENVSKFGSFNYYYDDCKKRD